MFDQNPEIPKKYLKNQKFLGFLGIPVETPVETPVGLLLKRKHCLGLEIEVACRLSSLQHLIIMVGSDDQCGVRGPG